MNDVIRPAAAPAIRMFLSSETPIFSVPARHNPRLQALAERINADDELRQLWRSANLNAVDRLGLGDCGEVHVRIVANAALKLLRLLREAGHQPAVVTHHGLTPDEAEIIVVLAAALHDLGLAVHSDPAVAARVGPVFADRKVRELLDGLYPARERAVLLAEALHAVVAQEANVECLTLEARVLKLADALDLSKGRARQTSEVSQRPGAVNTLPVVDEVTIQRAKAPPVRVVLRLARADGLPALEAMLQAKLERVPLGGLVEMLARFEDERAGTFQPIRVWQVGVI
jgi:metal-dependent HD superfamily phosphatase/phosphodiesterase